MTPLCIDTGAYAAFKRGDATITRLLESAPSLLIPAVVLGELYAGFAMGMRRGRNLLELSQFLSRSGCRSAAVDDGVARRYGELVAVDDLNLTVPNVIGFENLVQAIQRVWASPGPSG